MRKRVLLINFYYEKGLAVKYLSHELNKNGYESYILYFKEYDAFAPKSALEDELLLLEDVIREVNPNYIGLSVLTSLIMETVELVNKRIKSKFDIPVIWGGYYPTLFPEEAAQYSDYVIRGEGEKSFVELLNTLENGKDPSGVKNLVMICKDTNNIVKNPLLPLVQNLDDLGYYRLGESPVYLIKKGELLRGDPQIEDYSYDLMASRGCPFSCSFCSNEKLRKLYKGKGKFVRCRSVDSIIEELKEAKRAISSLKIISFWDEIFPDDPDWIEEFKEKYKKNINLPFEIMLHPLKINQDNMEKLVEAGLWKVLVGVQSGSYRIRKDIFNRNEKNESIIQASKILSEAKVPWTIYDIIIHHPFETVDDLKETFNLLMNMSPPFELRLHSLVFLPGTDVVEKALDLGVISLEELDKIKNSSMLKQYEPFSRGVEDNPNKDMVIWASLIYLSQFSVLKPYLGFLATKIDKSNVEKVVYLLKDSMKYIHKANQLSNKFQVFMRIPGNSYITNFSNILKHAFSKMWEKNTHR